MTIREEKDFPMCPYCNKRMAQIIEEGRLSIINVLREKLVFVATKNSMFELTVVSLVYEELAGLKTR